MLKLVEEVYNHALLLSLQILCKELCSSPSSLRKILDENPNKTEKFSYLDVIFPKNGMIDEYLTHETTIDGRMKEL
uniref:Aldo/keto reductase n=1 Tax=Solanum tuberosum TaxID=4113 RepID=M1A7Q1_SOLTU